MSWDENRQLAAGVLERTDAKGPEIQSSNLLPPYSPELNPVELIWSVLKSSRIGRMALKTKEQFLNAVSSGLKSIQRQKVKIFWIFPCREHSLCSP
ncbi:MAG: hypothetical protein GKR94_25745 [Gammaproteobacteria bacterium]|nr:hypothetical protein [Gammaproteobacteria bacterium]